MSAPCSCASSNGSINAHRSDPYEVSAEFGARVLDLPDVMSGTLDSAYKNDTLFVAMWLDSALDERYDSLEPGFQVWAIDPLELEAEELDPPALVSSSFAFHVAFGEGQALLVETGDTPVACLYADEEWNFLEMPPGVAVADTAFLRCGSRCRSRRASGSDRSRATASARTR